MKYNIVFTIILFGIICSCSKDKTNSDKKISAFSVVDTISFSCEGINTLAVTDSLIYISDYYNNSIHCYNFQGKEKFKFAGKGKGPGEFILAGAIAINNEKIAILDALKNRIQIFNLNGDFLESLKIDTEFMVMGFSSFFFCDNELYFETIKNKLLNADLSDKIISYHLNNLKKLEIYKSISLGMKITNPMQISKTMFPYKNSFIEIIPNESLIVNSTGKEISLSSIPEVSISNEIKNMIIESSDSESAKFKFPNYFPKVMDLFEINNSLFVFSYSQYFNNLYNPQNCHLYHYEMDKNIFQEINIPNYLPLANLEIVKNNVMFFIDRENDKIFIAKIELELN